MSIFSQAMDWFFCVNHGWRGPRRRKVTSQQLNSQSAEILEVRQLLTPLISLEPGGVLTIEGSAQDDNAQVSNGAGGTYRVTVRTGQETIAESYPRSQVNKIVFHGRSGNDEFRNNTNLPSEARGNDGHDKLTGGTNRDFLYGDRGEDILQGGAGNDVLIGGLGNDILLGRSGNDRLNGGEGTDQLFGDAGNDVLLGGGGNDALHGSFGDDTLRGGTGNDNLNGGAGNDLLFGEMGADILNAGAGHDELNGAGGADILRAGTGNDQLIGGEGQDTLIGEAGNDILTGNSGNDRLNGGPGKDQLFGGMGDDHLSGGADDDLLNGEAGDDQLNGGSGDDELIGDNGQDLLNGNSGNDTLITGASQPTTVAPAPVTIDTRLHVKAFGAVGNGIADDTDAIQAAFDAAAGGKTVYINPGTYRITDVLLISSFTTIEGAGANSVLSFQWADQTEGANFHIGNRNRKNEDAGDTKITLRNFVIQGGHSSLPYGVDQHSVTHGLSFRKVKDVVVTGIEVRKVSGFGIANTGLVGGTFLNNFIHDVGRDGLSSFPLIRENDSEFTDYPLTNLLISKNRFVNVGDDAIGVHAGTASSVNLSMPPSNIRITQNTITGRVRNHALAQGRGIALSGVKDAFVANNVIKDTVSTGILIQSWTNSETGSHPGLELRSRDIRIVNNTIQRAGQAVGLNRVKFGIQVKGANFIELTNNKVFDSADRGIDVRDTNDITLTRNQVTGSEGEYAILVAGGADHPVRRATVTDNIVRHHLEPAILLHEVITGIDLRNRVTLTL